MQGLGKRTGFLFKEPQTRLAQPTRVRGETLGPTAALVFPAVKWGSCLGAFSLGMGGALLGQWNGRLPPPPQKTPRGVLTQQGPTPRSP